MIIEPFFVGCKQQPDCQDYHNEKLGGKQHFYHPFFTLFIPSCSIYALVLKYRKTVPAPQDAETISCCEIENRGI